MRAPASALLAVALMPALPAWSQSEPPVRVQARLGSSLTISDQIDVRPDRSADRGAVLSLTPGVTVSARGAQLKGRLDYGLNLLAPWRVERDPQRVQHSLNANMAWQPRGTGFALAATASIAQQQQSAFGVQRSSTGAISLSDENRAEVYRVDLSPSFQTRLGPFAALTLSHRVGVSNTKDSLVGDAVTRGSSIRLGSPDRGLLNWTLGLEDSETRPKGNRRSETQTARLSLNWIPDSDWELGVSGGRERSSLSTAGQLRSGAIYGASLRWRPGPRTRLDLGADHRVFGNTYNLSLDHRFARSSIRISQTRGVTEPGLIGLGSSRTYYDLLFAQLAAVEPDPALRELLVLAQLQQLGLPRDALATAGSIAGRPTLTQSSLAAATWQTQRSTWTLTGSRSRSTRLGAATDGPDDDFRNSSLIDTTGFTLGVAYRLNPLDSVNLSFNWQRNAGDREELRTRLRTWQLAWSTRLGPRQQFSASLRHSAFASLSFPYDENALVLSYQQQF